MSAQVVAMPDPGAQSRNAASARSATVVRPPNVDQSTTGGLSATLLLAALVVISLAPLATLLMTALLPVARFPTIWTVEGDLDQVISVVTNRIVWRSMATSAMLALLTGVSATALGYLAARAIVRAGDRVRRIASAVAFLPVIAPPIALGVGVQVIALRAGLGGATSGVLLAHVVPATGYVTLFLLGVLRTYDHRMEEEARSLGASPWQVFVRVTIPALTSPLVVAIALGALVSWGQLALTLLVGGGAVRTLPVELLAFVRAGDDRLGAAAALLLTVPPAIAFGFLRTGARQTGAIT